MYKLHFGKSCNARHAPCVAFASTFAVAVAVAIRFCVKSFWPRMPKKFCLIICIIFVCLPNGFSVGEGNCTLMPREWREERAMPLIQFAISSPDLICGVP